MSINKVVCSKKCMSCGACKSQCPVKAIDMVYNPKEGFYRPVIDDSKCIECGKCAKICPALHQESDSLIGEYDKLVLAHSTDENVRRYSTSGGVINTLVRYLINNDYTDVVLLCTRDARSPIETGVVSVTKENIGELLTNPREFASRYVSVPVLSDLETIAGKNKRIAVVGTPCHIRAIHAIEQLPGNHSEFFKIGVTCSGGMSYIATKEYKRKMHLANSEMYYRGDGWPGKNLLKEGDKTVEFRHTSSFFEKMFSSQIFKNPGCRNCRDHFAEYADISFCDFWDKEEMSNEKQGNSCVIVRSAKATEIFDRMVADNQVELVKMLTEESVIKTQLRVLKAKKGDLHSNRKYKSFMKLCDWTFKSRIFKVFNIRVYRFFCNYYTKLCNSAKL